MCNNKKCRINHVIDHLSVELLKWILTQPNIQWWKYDNKTVLYTSLTLLDALNNNQFEVADWIKNNSIGWNKLATIYYEKITKQTIYLILICGIY